MFKPSFALAALALAAVSPTFAQTSTEPAAAAAAQSPWAFSANIGLFSDYRFRGISQTDRKPALQGGFDLAHSSGLYAGNWNSNVDSALFNGANLEMDFYGGYKHAFDGGFGLDLGVIYYYYPNSGSSPVGSTRIDNTELYIGASYGPVSLKYNYAVSDFFGTPDSSGSSYLDAGFAYDLGHNFGLVAHYGYQWLRGGAVVTQIDGSTANNISDWKLGLTYTIDGWVIGLAYVATNRDLTGGTAALTNRNISGNTAVASVTKTF
ncbi:MAG TPA: TorF family putative porin [Burkholderiaceae bacterium]|nr:TorF family putative porin [Burkholderiaceae bacterium]